MRESLSAWRAVYHDFPEWRPDCNQFIKTVVNHLGKPEMLAFTNQIALSIDPSQERMGVYVLAAIFGLLVSGIVSCIKEARNEAASRL